MARAGHFICADRHLQWQLLKNRMLSVTGSAIALCAVAVPQKLRLYAAPQ
jgi:hypothetical protein